MPASRKDIMALRNILNPERTSRDRPRYTYSKEQAAFIWHCRIDLGMSWDQVKMEYGNHWNQIRDKSGLQCKYYRMLSEHGIHGVREQSRRRSTSDADSTGR